MIRAAWASFAGRLEARLRSRAHRWKQGIIQRLQPTESPSRLARCAGTFWAASQTEEQRRDLSHWRGVGRWASDAAWLEIGESSRAMFLTLCRLSGRTEPVNVMMEWGPGGGANAVAFSSLVSHYIGVDISQANLDECQRQLQLKAYNGFRPILIDAERPEECAAAIGGAKVDFFLSTAVYQHFPGKAYGATVTRTAAKLLRDGGLAIIQIRYDDGSEVVRAKTRDYFENAISFTSYRVDEFWTLCKDVGLEPLAVTLECKASYAYFLLRKSIGSEAHGR